MHAENLTVTAVAELLVPLFRYVWECGTGLDNLSRPEIEGGMAKTVALQPQQPEGEERVLAPPTTAVSFNCGAT